MLVAGDQLPGHGRAATATASRSRTSSWTAAAAAAGARTFTDGIDTGGILHSMSSTIPNAETTESRSPVLQVYRRERRDSGGHGRFRGGVGIEFGMLPHKNPIPIVSVTLASGVSQPEGHGLSGGSPASAKSNVVFRSSNVPELFASGVIPDSTDGVTGTQTDVLQAKDHTHAGRGRLPRHRGVRRRRVRRSAAARPRARRARPAATGSSPRRSHARCTAWSPAIRPRPPRRATRSAPSACATGGPWPTAWAAGRSRGRGCTASPTRSRRSRARSGRALRCTECGHRLGDYGDDHKQGTLVRELPDHRDERAQRARARRRDGAARVLLPRLRHVGRDGRAARRGAGVLEESRFGAT